MGSTSNNIKALQRFLSDKIHIVEAFLSIPPGKWQAKHSREWESVFSTWEPIAARRRNHAHWSVPTPTSPNGITEKQRELLEITLRCLRTDLEYAKLLERAYKVGIPVDVSKQPWDYKELAQFKERILKVEEESKHRNSRTL